MSLQVAPPDLAALEPHDHASPSALRWISWGSNEHATFLGVPSTAFQPLVSPAPAKPSATIDPEQKHAQKVLKTKTTYKVFSPSAKPSASASPYVSSVARRKQHFTHPSPSASTTSFSSVYSPITSDSLTTLSIATNASSRMPKLAHVGVIDIKFLSTQKLPKEEKKTLKENPKDTLAETPEPPTTPPVPSVKRRGGTARAGPATTAGTKAATAGKGKGRRKPGARNAQNDEGEEDKEKKEREVQLFRFLPPSQQPDSGPYVRYSPMYHPYHPFRSMHREVIKKEKGARNPPPKPEPVVEKEVEEPPPPQRRQSSRQKKQTTRLTAAEKKEKAKEAKERAKERAKEKALKAKEAAKDKVKEAANSKTESKETPPEREPSPPVVATRSRAAAAAAKTAAASKSKSSGNALTTSGDSRADAKSGAIKGRASRATTAGAKRKREEDEEQATEEITPPPKRPRRGAATRSANAQNGSNDTLDGDEQAQDNASQEGSSNGNPEEYSASSPTADPPNGDKPPQRRMRPGTRKTQAARAAAMAAKARGPSFHLYKYERMLMGEGQKRSLAERENKSPGDESMELDQDGAEYDIPPKVEAVEEKEEAVADAAAASSPPLPTATATATAAAQAPTPKPRGRGGKSRGGVSRGRASAKRRTGVRGARASQKEAEEEHAEEHEAEHVEEHVEESQEVRLALRA